ncbi:MAG: dTMP kinase [Actinobacteria bacterium]|nr:dTMP kinase [Actinomycetota bacterium]
MRDRTERRAGYRQLLKDSSIKLFFAAQAISSFGDWIGLIAILALAHRIYNNEFAVAAVLFARLAPALLFGPVGGVLVDRWDRKKVMVFADLARAVMIATLPFVQSIGRVVPLLNPAVLLFIVSALLEMLTILWQSAKDAAIPAMIRKDQLTHTYSLFLMAAYATFPISGAAFGLLSHLARVIGSATHFKQFVLGPENLALFFDGISFMLSAALMTTIAVPKREGSRRPMNLRAVWSDLKVGIATIARHPMIRPWVFGIAGTYAGIGIFLSMSVFFVSDILHGGPASFGFLVTAIGIGLGVGFAIAAGASRPLSKDVVFSLSVGVLGGALVGFGSVSTITPALVWAGVAGFGAGIAYPSGYALVQERIGEAVRGRVSAAITSVIRLSLVGASSVAPVMVRLIDDVFGKHTLAFAGQHLDIRGIRAVMWLGGLLVLSAGAITTNAVRARRRLAIPSSGLFVVFEGGEGAGKSTQMRALRIALEARGFAVVVTREPGGTRMGEAIRDQLLDPNNRNLSPLAETLMYAADRAQHVHEVIMPALASGSIVVSDRYLDSSVAYQGVARGLGEERVMELNRWATSGLLPDIVFLLDFDAGKGLTRSGVTDRIEQESLGFHQKVRDAYLYLADRHADRFVVIDASQPEELIAAEILSRVLAASEEMTARRVISEGVSG